MLVLLHIRVLFSYKLCYCNAVHFCYLHKPLKTGMHGSAEPWLVVLYSLHMASSVRKISFRLVSGTANINILCHTLFKNICIFVFLSINFAFLTAYGLKLWLEQFQPVVS